MMHESRRGKTIHPADKIKDDETLPGLRSLSARIMGSLAALGFILSGCAGTALDGGSGGTVKQAPDPHFYQHWLNSYEEQTAGGPVVFRARGSMTFPPGRFRMAYVFNTDGSCQYLQPGANDAHRLRDCVFTKVGRKVYLYDEAGNLVPDLSFTLTGAAGKERMSLTKGVAPAATADNKAKP